MLGSLPLVLYDGGLRILEAGTPLLAVGKSKVARGVRGRRRERELFREWATQERDPARPLVWIHAPSVGEGLQARIVLEALLEARPGLQSAYTHFSPSAEDLARRVPADVAGYLPWDTGPRVREALDALRPELLAFTKTEVWPVLTREAHRREIPVVLLAATLPEGAGRLGGPGRFFLRPTFSSLDRVLAISPEDGARFARLGVPEERVRVTGDPAVDSAWTRLKGVDPSAPHLAPFREGSRPTLVAGSTWPPDEAVLLPALEKVRARVPELRLVVAPHEPDEAHLAPLEAELTRRGWRHCRLGEVEGAGGSGRGLPTEVDAVVVDRVGVLAELYTVGTAAFVGGGFHRFGLHSVLEPAAAGLPVTFGPGFGNSLAAAELLREGGARVVSGSGELGEVLEEWMGGEAGRQAGGRALGYVERHRGAAQHTVEALLPFLE